MAVQTKQVQGGGSGTNYRGEFELIQTLFLVYRESGAGLKGTSGLCRRKGKLTDNYGSGLSAMGIALRNGSLTFACLRAAVWARWNVWEERAS